MPPDFKPLKVVIVCLVGLLVGFALCWGVPKIGNMLEPPGHKTRRDHMDQLDRIEEKIDQLIEIGEKWE